MTDEQQNMIVLSTRVDEKTYEEIQRIGDYFMISDSDLIRIMIREWILTNRTARKKPKNVIGQIMRALEEWINS